MFGVDIDVILKREAHGEDIPPDAVPRVLEILLTEIETRGLTEQGICELNVPVLITNRRLMRCQIVLREPPQK